MGQRRHYHPLSRRAVANYSTSEVRIWKNLTFRWRKVACRPARPTRSFRYQQQLAPLVCAREKPCHLHQRDLASSSHLFEETRLDRFPATTSRWLLSLSSHARARCSSAERRFQGRTFATRTVSLTGSLYEATPDDVSNWISQSTLLKPSQMLFGAHSAPAASTR